MESTIGSTALQASILFLEEASQQEKLAKEWCFKPCEIRELSHHLTFDDDSLATSDVLSGELSSKPGWATNEIAILKLPFVLSVNEFFMPGLVDTHIHAPQYSFAGSNVDLPRLEWLTKYTFPTEHKFQSIDFAEEVYTRVVRRTLKNGTTTACYFGTIHTDSSLLLAEITDKFGQRAFVGKICMDLNDLVPEYKETTEESIKETERLSSGLLNVPEVLKHGVKTGLGTDVAGGYSSSMLDAIRRAVMVSNILLINKINSKSLTLKEVFRLATLGGSQALGLDREIGNFEVGKEFDALLINPKASDSPIDLFYGDFIGEISEAVIQKFLYLGDDRNIEEVYVGGKQVVPFSSS
ncbi:hypothetical protein Celaphus_00018370, partial [Cervus elaphus hippelaphus]